MMGQVRSSFLLLFMLFSSIIGYGRNYHVSINGKDSNTRTVENPFRTLEMARDALDQVIY